MGVMFSMSIFIQRSFITHASSEVENDRKIPILNSWPVNLSLATDITNCAHANTCQVMYLILH